MHAITKIHYQGGRLARVLLHHVQTKPEDGFELGEGCDTPVEMVARLLNRGDHIRVAVAILSKGFVPHGFITRSWQGDLIALPLVATEHTRLDALPTY
jgi:hypothetical protein